MHDEDPTLYTFEDWGAPTGSDYNVLLYTLPAVAGLSGGTIVSLFYVVFLNLVKLSIYTTFYEVVDNRTRKQCNLCRSLLNRFPSFRVLIDQPLSLSLSLFYYEKKTENCQ